MKIKMNEILNLYKQFQVELFLEKITGYSIDEKGIQKDKVSKYWNFVGDNDGNNAIIGMLKDPDKGLIERITNAIDAVIEKEVDIRNLKNLSSSEDVIKVCYPKFYQNRIDVARGIQTRSNAVEASEKIIVAINDGATSSRPTLDIIDQGKGIEGNRFASTILSITGGNKLSSDKSYTIGAFGQGGSTSLAFAKSTIIISKKNNEYFFTIVKKVKLVDLKNYTYMYLTIDGEIPRLEVHNDVQYDYLNVFLNAETGTLVRMIESEISKEYIRNDITKPTMLSDYINTELYNVALPIKVIENRTNFRENTAKQNRNCFGSFNKLQTWSYVKKEYSGTISIEHRNKEFEISYYIILPDDKNEWAKDSKCREVFEQLNIHLEPIIYTVNGQYIASESINRLKKMGLNFLQYRLFVEINLDKLGTEKYDFFTTDRAQIKKTELSNGFIEKVIERLKNEKNIIEINNIIAENSINTQIDNDMLKDISNKVKGEYSRYLRSGCLIINGGDGNRLDPDEDSEYFDEIKDFQITTKKQIYRSNEAVNIILSTKAMKSVNKDNERNISLFLDGKQYLNYIPSFMNGRIQYTIYDVSVGIHKISFDLFKNNSLVNRSNVFEFAITPDKLAINPDKQVRQKDLNLNIKVVEYKEIIVDVIKNDVDKSILINICLDSNELINEVYGRTASTDEIQVIKNNLIEPLALFSLYMGENYDNIESVDEKNKLILSFIKTLHTCGKIKDKQFV